MNISFHPIKTAVLDFYLCGKNNNTDSPFSAKPCANIQAKLESQRGLFQLCNYASYQPEVLKKLASESLP